MHVTRVELENIKSYEHQVYTFGPGITAITGENGAGKTTILEAIAWALFDTLEYSKEDFLRRGAKKGSVRVTFLSDIDERLYTVYRDTGHGYYVYDQREGIKLAERKADVSGLLRKLLGMEPGTDIRSLFSSAIGVPQGTFTADFLRPANQRKASFDKLLKVEEYRDGAEYLLGTVHLIRERMAEVRGRIEGAEGQLARYDELVEEQSAAARSLSQLEAILDQLQREIAERSASVALMERAEQNLRETASRADRLEVAREMAARRLQDVRTLLDAAQAALERQRAVEADHQKHLGALDLLRRMETERAERDRLRAEADNVGRLMLTAAADVRRLEEALARAAEARVQVVALEPEVARQEELERERERLRDLRARALSARERLAQLDAELQQLRAQHAQTRERLREAEKGAGAGERLEALINERMGVEAALSKAEQAATSLRHLTSQRKDLAREAERLRREVSALEKEIAALEKHAAKAEETAALITLESELTEQLAHLRAEISRDEKFHKEVKNGLCPILSERCLNIGEGQTLEDYFKDQFAANTTQLTALEKERARLGLAVREAREAEKYLSRLDGVRAQLAAALLLLNERQETLAQLDRDINQLPLASREHLNTLRAQLSGIDLEQASLREAALRYAELKPLAQRLQEIEHEGKRKRDDRESVAAVAAAVAGLEKEIEEAEQSLSLLNDPRGRVAALRLEAASEAALSQEVMLARSAHSVLDQQSQVLKAQLEPFAQLDARWAAASQERDRTSEAHREYLSSETLVQTLPERQAAMKSAEDEASRIALEAAEARREHERAAAGYNRDEHMTEQAALNSARERAAAATAQLEAAQLRSSALAAELERLSEVRAQRIEEIRALDKLKEWNEATEFIRDTLKQAGPLVTESYLYNISIEANQLFREITGEAGRALRWSRDYEIMLEEEGHERSFQNLSGGEQMAAALSIRLALLKQLSDIRLAFFDEPTVNMDAERRERLAQQIGQVQHFDQLFVISHDDTFEESVDHIIHVERHDKSEAMRDEG
ncbi:MAG TPA: SMC family ATPase [Pyrinomonadaceae bacterium]|jgi:exonuclease SbcC